MNYKEWFEHKVSNSNDLEDGFIESRRVEFDDFCKEEYEKELKGGKV